MIVKRRCKRCGCLWARRDFGVERCGLCARITSTGAPGFRPIVRLDARDQWLLEFGAA